MRAIAVLLVFVSHYFFHWPVFGWGWIGLDLFFVLSGFLITGILFDTRHREHRFRDFYIRRFLRIFPLYYGLIFLVIALTPVFRWRWSHAWLLWIPYMQSYQFLTRYKDTDIVHLVGMWRHHRFFSLDTAHLWSLCVEEQFYLVWPFVVFFIKDRVRLRNLCIALWILPLAARVACVFLAPQAQLDAGLLYFFPPLRVDSLIFGSLLALLLRGPEEALIKKLAAPVSYVILISFGLFEAIHDLYTHTMYRANIPDYRPVLDTVGFTVVDILMGAVILMALDSSTRIYRTMMVKPLRKLGKISYGFYVFHLLLRNISDQLSTHFFGVAGKRQLIGSAILGLCGTAVISWLSFRLFESPFLRLKDRFAS